MSDSFDELQRIIRAMFAYQERTYNRFFAEAGDALTEQSAAARAAARNLLLRSAEVVSQRLMHDDRRAPLIVPADVESAVRAYAAATMAAQPQVAPVDLEIRVCQLLAANGARWVAVRQLTGDEYAETWRFVQAMRTVARRMDVPVATLALCWESGATVANDARETGPVSIGDVFRIAYRREEHQRFLLLLLTADLATDEARAVAIILDPAVAAIRRVLHAGVREFAEREFRHCFLRRLPVIIERAKRQETLARAFAAEECERIWVSLAAFEK